MAARTSRVGKKVEVMDDDDEDDKEEEEGAVAAPGVAIGM